MEQRTLLDTLENVQSQSIKSRKIGLDELKEALERRQNSLHATELPDSTVHLIYEAIFKATTLELLTYSKISKQSLKEVSAQRLAHTAATLRTAVSLTNTYIRKSTVKALIDHVSQSLWARDDQIHEPLSHDYIKSLELVLGHPYHTEHLLSGDWKRLLKFCVKCLKILIDGAESTSEALSFRLSSSQAFESFDESSIRRTARPDGSATRLTIISLLACLYSLTATPNSPADYDAAQVIAIALTVLRTYVKSKIGVHLLSIRIIRNVLSRLILNSSSLATNTVVELFPILHAIWPNVQHAVRTEILAICLQTKSHLISLLHNGRGIALVSHVETLIEAITRDNSKVNERTLLDLEDLSLVRRSFPPPKCMPMQLHMFCVREATLKSEFDWSVNYLVALLSSWLDVYKLLVPEKHHRETLSSDQDDQVRGKTKRPRQSRAIHELVLQTSRDPLSKRIAALQALSFLVQLRHLTIDELDSSLEILLSHIASDNPTVSSWAMIVVGACTAQKIVALSTLETPWEKAWHLASRLVSSRSHSRAACFLLNNLIEHHLVGQDLVRRLNAEFCQSPILNGPAVLADTTLSLWVILHGFISTSGNSDSIDGFTEQWLTWLFKRWTPSNINEKPYIRHLSHTINLRDLITAFCTILDLQCPPSSSFNIMPLGEIGQVWLENLDRHVLLRQILLLDDHESSTMSLDAFQAEQSTQIYASRPNFKGELFVLRLCAEEIESMRSAFEAAFEARSTHVLSPELVRVTITFCTVCDVLTSAYSRKHSDSLKLSKDVNSLLSLIFSKFGSTDSEQELCDAALLTVACLLPREMPLDTFRQDIGISQSFSQSLSRLSIGPTDRPSEQLHMPKLARKISGFDSDDEFEPQPMIQERTESTRLPRSLLALRSSTLFCTSSIASYLWYLSIPDIVSGTQHGDKSTLLVDYIVNLSPNQLLQSGHFLRICIDQAALSHHEAVRRLLKFVDTKLLRTFEYERFEPALALCALCLSGTAGLWTSKEAPENLRLLASEMYVLLVDGLSGETKISPQVQIGVSDLLFEVLKVDPDFAQNLSCVSVRTSLFQILQNSEILVNFHIAQNISSIFDSFSVSQHDLIFADVQQCLPHDSDWPEGMYIRLVILTRLAAAWSSLLRRCIYHVFETAGVESTSVPYATACVKVITVALDLHEPRSLFLLFQYQILFTWLQDHSLHDIPYSIFGYQSLVDLLKDAQDEIVSQIVMQQDYGSLLSLEGLLSQSRAQLIEQAFGRVVAYGIAKDQELQSSQGDAEHTTESYIENLIGVSRYLTLLRKRAPEIMGHFFLRMGTDDKVEKYLTKYPILPAAAGILNAIRGNSSSTAPVSSGQQPAFKSIRLLPQIEWLCRRLGIAVDTIWSPFLTTVVARMLFDDMIPALGEMQIRCSVRKLRTLVGLAGPNVLYGYPLEMLLHGLRPLIMNPASSKDTIGIVQYLIEYGQESLKQSQSFWIGYYVTCLISLKQLIQRPQAEVYAEAYAEASPPGSSDTAVAFRDWLCEFTLPFKPAMQSETMKKHFNFLCQSSREFSCADKEKTQVARFHLLRHILADFSLRRQMKNILSPSYFDECLQQTCVDFQSPQCSGEDSVFDQRTILRLSESLWTSCEKLSLPSQYRAWVSNIMGRFFRFQGELPSNSDKETQLTHFKASTTSGARYETKLVPELAIVRYLVDLLFKLERSAVGVVERALRLIHFKCQNDEYNSAISQCIPTNFLGAFTLEHEIDILPVHKTDKIDWAPNSLREGEIGPLMTWSKALALYLSSKVPTDSLVGSLREVINDIHSSAQELLPYILHCALIPDRDSTAVFTTKAEISSYLNRWFEETTKDNIQHTHLLIESVFYLRSQIPPSAGKDFDRNSWLDLDYLQLARAARSCSMYKYALLSIEIWHEMTLQEGQSSTNQGLKLSHDLLLSIFQDIDEPDSYYGVPQNPSLDTIANRLDYEGSGIEGLMFREAQLESEHRAFSELGHVPFEGITASLRAANLNALIIMQPGDASNAATRDDRLFAAQKLGQWNIPVAPGTETSNSAVYTALRALSYEESLSDMVRSVQASTSGVFDRMQNARAGISLRQSFRALSVLSEIYDVLISPDAARVMKTLKAMAEPEPWMANGSLDDMALLLTSRESFTSLLTRNSNLSSVLRQEQPELLLTDVHVNLASASLYRKHGALQEALSCVSYLNNMLPACNAAGLNVEDAVRLETANVLWERGELIPAISLLRTMNEAFHGASQTITVSRSQLLSVLGRRVSDARLESPYEVLQTYLEPSLHALDKDGNEHAAGRVLHDFASFCQLQLSNPEDSAEITRVEKLKAQKEAEIAACQEELKRLANTAASNHKTHEREKQATLRALSEAIKWLKMDEAEVNRLYAAREALLTASLDNYLRTLAVSDAHDEDALRFLAIWLEHNAHPAATASVQTYLEVVSSYKFVALMNQLTSRIADIDSPFQKQLQQLVYRICEDHPHHGMYHLCSASANAGSSDAQSASRATTAIKIGQRLKASAKSQKLWLATNRAHALCLRLARWESQGYRTGHDIPVKDVQPAAEFSIQMPRLHLPPITMSLDVQPSCDYKRVPVIAEINSEMRLMNGNSVPKALIVTTSDGRSHTQLYKSNDDLRQDAIMEQVFEQVNTILKRHASTRQRSLRVRTYNVIPLSSTAGVIEFVPGTMPLHDYLVRAHNRYYPEDWKFDVCRQKIVNVDKQGIPERVRVFREVQSHYHPVLRHFLFERFHDPDEWFERRLAYTRSCAAISILGHALGLGDRHCHNILLDRHTGEVVHIDLGIAFEAGRVLKIPELVPFRLTNDIVDGFGVMKTEGIFRRCCGFTLDVLRQEKDSIMTLLNVLRYDPLYRWTLSPLRAKRAQAMGRQATANDAMSIPNGGNMRTSRSSSKAGSASRTYLLPDASGSTAHDGNEAERALSVVERKLSPTLSVMAAVNELIQQATDEKNLALLFGGWAAFS